MLSVIGLGAAGCNIAEMFENNSEVNVYLIDSEIEGDNCFSLETYSSPEEYEKNLPSLKNFLKDCHDDVLFIVGGSGKISGASLKILENVKNKNISVLYIRPDLLLLSSMNKMQDRITFNVLQEYARSGIFKNIYLIDNCKIESIIGDIPAIGYYETLNKVIFNAVSFIEFYKNKKAVINNFIQPKDYCRISTIGVYDINENNEKMFYDLKNIEDICYYYIINENVLKTDGKLFKNIKERMKEKVTAETKISYKIFSSSSENNYCYFVAYSKKIQE